MVGIERMEGSQATILAVFSKHSWRKNTWVAKLSSFKNNNNNIFVLIASPLVDLVPIVSIWVSGGKVWENSSASVDLEYGH